MNGLAENTYHPITTDGRTDRRKGELDIKCFAFKNGHHEGQILPVEGVSKCALLWPAEVWYRNKKLFFGQKDSLYEAMTKRLMKGRWIFHLFVV